MLEFIALVPRNTEDLFIEELKAFTGSYISHSQGEIHFSAPIKTAYSLCLWSRIATRILLVLHRFEADNKDTVYSEIHKIPWDSHFDNDQTFAVNTFIYSEWMRHSRYGGLIVKDAVVDYFRENTGKRPDVKTEQPAIQLEFRLNQTKALICLDLSGESLDKRGYKTFTSTAPLKENLAAAILYRAGWPKMAEAGAAFIDPMCGTGTLVLEAAFMASNTAPGFFRTYFGFLGWKQHDSELWKTLREDAEQQRKELDTESPRFFGTDIDPRAAAAAKGNAKQCGLDQAIHFRRGPFQQVHQSDLPTGTGLIATNPPYGERIGEREDLPALYHDLGEFMTRCCSGWNAVVLTGDRELAHKTGMRAKKINNFYNGSIPCITATFSIMSREEREARARAGREKAFSNTPATPGEEMLSNRLKKNEKRMRKWRKRENITCYRLYDADMPEYAAAIDLYNNEWAYVQEYAPPATIDPAKAKTRLKEIIRAIPYTLGIEPKQIILKQRKRQKGSNQYQKTNQKDDQLIIEEQGLQFLVNLQDYLDTGIFLDHRPMRRIIREEAKGKTFLNLFCYTGTVSVYAAQGGALSVTSVDNSNTYLDWARENMRLNHLETDKNFYIKDDCFRFLKEDDSKYDLIFLDPPTFSNSKGKTTFDIQTDHVNLLKLTADHLRPNGVLYFSNNFRKFKMSEELNDLYNIEEITAKTLDPDFERRGNIHKVFKITRK